jgi:uncharacterized protein DUF4267
MAYSGIRSQISDLKGKSIGSFVMTGLGCLKASSVLFRFAALLALGIIFVGGRFLFDPFAVSRDFGVPAAHNSTLAYLWRKGTRDIVSGLLLLSLLRLGVRRTVLSAFIFITTLIPLADFLNAAASMALCGRAGLVRSWLAPEHIVSS